MKRNFIFKDGVSNKFWNISYDETSYTVTYGKVGSSGVSKTSNYEKISEVNSLINSKVKKGYKEITDSNEEVVEKVETKVEVKEVKINNSDTLNKTIINDFEMNEDKTILYSYKGSSNSVVLPDTIKIIESSAFSRSKIEKVEIQEGVVSIGNLAFFCCENLCDITLPNSLKKIGRDAFYSCNKLTSFTIPEGVEEISSSILSACNELLKVDILCNINVLPSSMFSRCEALKEVNIKNEIIEIEESCFSNCKELVRVTNIENVKKIGNSAFNQCSKINNVNFLKAEIVGDSAFDFCKSVTKVNLPSIKELGRRVFFACSIEEVILSNEIKELKEDVFCYNKNLEYINIPDSVIKICTNAFENCTNLKEVKMSSNIKILECAAFFNCTKLNKINIPDTLEEVGYDTFLLCDELNLDFNNIKINKSLESLIFGMKQTIRNRKYSIEDDEFYNSLVHGLRLGNHVNYRVVDLLEKHNLKNVDGYATGSDDDMHNFCMSCEERREVAQERFRNLYDELINYASLSRGASLYLTTETKYDDLVYTSSKEKVETYVKGDKLWVILYEDDLDTYVSFLGSLNKNEIKITEGTCNKDLEKTIQKEISKKTKAGYVKTDDIDLKRFGIIIQKTIEVDLNDPFVLALNEIKKLKNNMKTLDTTNPSYVMEVVKINMGIMKNSGLAKDIINERKQSLTKEEVKQLEEQLNEAQSN